MPTTTDPEELSPAEQARRAAICSAVDTWAASGRRPVRSVVASRTNIEEGKIGAVRYTINHDLIATLRVLRGWGQWGGHNPLLTLLRDAPSRRGDPAHVLAWLRERQLERARRRHRERIADLGLTLIKSA